MYDDVHFGRGCPAGFLRPKHGSFMVLCGSCRSSFCCIMTLFGGVHLPSWAPRSPAISEIGRFKMLECKESRLWKLFSHNFRVVGPKARDFGSGWWEDMSVLQDNAQSHRNNLKVVEV